MSKAKGLSVATTKVIKSLKEELEMYDDNIGDDPEEANNYYMKGVTLIKLSSQIEDSGYHAQALEAFNKAIELTSEEDPLYLIERSKLHVAMGNNDLAVIDYGKASNLPAQGGAAGIFIKKTIKSIEKLDNIKSTITRLSKEGKINPELAEKLKEHAEITQGLVVTAQDHEDRIHSLEKALQEVLAHGKASNEALKGLGMRVDVLEERLNQLAEEFKITREEMTSMIGKFKDLGIDKEEAGTILSSVAVTFNDPVLRSIIDEYQQEHADNEKLQELLRDPYNADLYQCLRFELNTTYLASMVVQTDIVKNSKVGVAGNVGSILQAVSSHVPMVGFGVQILGMALKMVDAYYQDQMLNNYAKVVGSAQEMDELAKLIGGKLIASKLSSEKLHTEENMFKAKCLKIIKTGLGIVADASGEVDELWSKDGALEVGASVVSEAAEAAQPVAQSFRSKISSKFEKAKGFFKKKHNEGANDQEEKQKAGAMAAAKAEEENNGESDASIVAKTIISKIYGGEAAGYASIADKADYFIMFIQNNYGSDADPEYAAVVVGDDAHQSSAV